MFRLILCTLFFTSLAQADDKKIGLTNESALGYVVTGGNSESETTSLNQKSSYKWLMDEMIFTGHYIQANGKDQTTQLTSQTAENWAATLRYEKVITPKWFSAFLAHGWYGDLFQGIREGHATDLGAKYYTSHSKTFVQYFELGYRYSRELFRSAPTPSVGSGAPINPEFHQARLKAQIDYAHSKTLSLGAWVEYLPSITNFSEDQRLNYSPYLSSVLTDMFSLKVAYEGRYRYKQPVATNKLTDYTFTTSLIAKF